MLFQLVGVFRRLGRRPNWLAISCLCLFFSSAAYSQNSASSTATPVDAQNRESAQQENDRIVQLALAATAKQGEYVIGSGDLLSLEVFDVSELTRDLRVNESGFVSIPLISTRVQAAGLTATQFQDKVTELLKVNELVNNPEVTVTVKEQHSQPIMVAGAVKTPVVIQAVHQLTLLEALSQAGGIAEDAGGRILITRAGDVTGVTTSSSAPGSDPNDVAASGTVISIELTDLLDSGDSKFNIPLLGGDVVSVPRGGVIYAVGAVKVPGGYVMQGQRQDMTILKLMALSGGLQPTAKPGQAVIIRRDLSGAERQEVHVDLSKILTLKTEDVRLQQNDILFVPDSNSKHVWRKTGEIAIGLAGGATLIAITKL